MIPFALALVALVGVLVLHMLRPFFAPRRISAARFFRPEDEATSHERRPTFARPWKSPPLYAQLLAFGLLAYALLPAGCGSPRPAIGLWILLDTSASTSTRSPLEGGGEERFEGMRSELLDIVDSLAAGRSQAVFHLSTFDHGVSHHGVCLAAGTVRERLAGLAHRPLGTDLVALRSVLESSSGPLPPDGAEPPCALTHRLVSSDLPAPEWVAELAPEVVWLHHAEPVANLGFETLRAVVDPLAGEVLAVEVRTRAYGERPATRLRVRSVSNPQQEEVIPVDWSARGTWRHRLELAPGRWRLELSPGDAYAYDDRAEIEVPAGRPEPIAIRGLDSLEGMTGAAVGNVSVGASGAASGAATGERGSDGESGASPLLVLGRGYGADPRPTVGFFDDASPLLEGIDLDRLADEGPRGVPLPPGFEPVLTGLAGHDEVWLAIRHQPPAVLVPGLPGARGESGPGEAARRSAARMAANALRWLAEGRSAPMLWIPTTVEHPEPEGIRLALHPGEGKTDQAIFSSGSPADLRAVRAESADRSSRRWLVVAAGLVFLVDQGLLAWWRGWR